MPLFEIAEGLNPIEELKRVNTDAGFSEYPLGINGMGEPAAAVSFENGVFSYSSERGSAQGKTQDELCQNMRLNSGFNTQDFAATFCNPPRSQAARPKGATGQNPSQGSPPNEWISFFDRTLDKFVKPPKQKKQRSAGQSRPAQDRPQQKESDNTLLYAGIGAAVLVAGLLAFSLSSSRKKQQ